MVTVRVCAHDEVGGCGFGRFDRLAGCIEGRSPALDSRLGQRPFDLADSDADMPAGVDADSADRLGDGIGVVQDALDLVTDGAGEGNDRVDRREDVEDPRHRVVA